MKPKINSDYAWFKLSIFKSPIHGFGVIAEQNIPKDRWVIEYTGEVENRRQAKGKDDTFVYRLDNRAYWLLDGAVRGSGAERVNHSCSPNLVAYTEGKRVYFYSIRRIKKGEELTVDYHYAPCAPVDALLCKCGAKTCRGTVNQIN